MAGGPDMRSVGRSRRVAAGLVALVAVFVAVAVGWPGLHHDDPRSHPAEHAGGSSRALSTAAETGAATSGRARRFDTRALTALEQWDRRRSAAYATGSTARLRRLYVPGSPAGVADVTLLNRYLHRGFRVRGMRTQVLAVTVLDHRQGRWRVRVTDRLVGAVATRAGQRVRLPQGRAGRYVLTLVRHDASDGASGGDGASKEESDAWRVASVRSARAPVS